jgi:hypothetical protein
MNKNLILLALVLLTGCGAPTPYKTDNTSYYEHALDALNRNDYEAAFRLLESYYEPDRSSYHKTREHRLEADELFKSKSSLITAGLNTFSETSFKKTLVRHRGDSSKAIKEESNRLKAFKEISPELHKTALNNFISFFGNSPEFFLTREIDAREEAAKKNVVDSNMDINRVTNPVLKQRLSNAKITTSKFANGSTLTNVKFAGSLQPNHALDCVSIKEVNNKYNPPSLVYAAKKCIQQDQHKKAWELLTTATGFAYYDIKHLADRSARGARTVLMMNALSGIDKKKMDATRKISAEIQADAQQVKAYCDELKRIGPPTYEPQWAIKHGMGVYDDPRNGDYLTNVDSKELWDEVLINRCTPIKPKNS